MSFGKERSVTVTLLLVRHGEREDEAMKLSMSAEELRRHALLPSELQQQVTFDTLDPSLTEAGYAQATATWRNIWLAIIIQQQTQHRQQPSAKALLPVVPVVTLACSPLRRCIGTAMMLVAAFPFVTVPTPTTAADTDTDTDTTGTGSSSDVPVSLPLLRDEAMPDTQNTSGAAGTTLGSTPSTNTNGATDTTGTSSCLTSPIDFCSSFQSAAVSAVGSSDSTPAAAAIPVSVPMLVPVLVMNGLAACAAAIFKLGGVSQAIMRYGCDIPCAVPVSVHQSNNHDHHDRYNNNNAASINPFNVALQSMIHVAQKPFQNMFKSQQQQLSLAASLQFFGTVCNNSNSECWFPLSSVITAHSALRASIDDVRVTDNNMMRSCSPDQTIPTTTTTTDHNNAVEATVSTTSFSTPERQPKKAARLQSVTTNMNSNSLNTNDNDESFMDALDQAVRIALNTVSNDCTTDDDPDIDDRRQKYLIVVTHREGIRSLIQHCTKTYHRYKTPYCCIGTFTATTKSRCSNNTCPRLGPSDISYTFHNICAYENFTL